MSIRGAKLARQIPIFRGGCCMKKVKLGELVSIQTGKLDANAAVVGGKYPFFTTAKEISWINDYVYDDEVVLVAGNGDLNVKYYKGKFNAYQRTYILSNNSNVRMKYLYYFLDKYIKVLRHQSIGGVIKYIKLNNLSNAQVPMMSIPEQEKIIKNLEKIDYLISKKSQQYTELSKLVKSRFNEMFGDPVLNDMGWEIETLDKVGTIGRGVSKYRPRNASELFGGIYPFIQTGDVANSGNYIVDYHSTYSEFGLKQSKLWDKGTLCITIAANIAKTSILAFDSCFPDSIVGFIPGERTNNMFIHYWFSYFQKMLESQAPESAQKNINLKILSELKVILPPLALQNEFADFVAQVDKSQLAIQKSLEELETLKKSLMQEYFG